LPPIAAASIAGAALLAWLIWPFNAGADLRPRAVIVDQLAATDPNPGFVADAIARLEGAGYAVDYVPSEAVTVDLFRHLPKQGHGIVMVRGHTGQLTSRPSTAVFDVGDGRWFVPGVLRQQVPAFFTNEVYSGETHLPEQRERQLVITSYPQPAEDARRFFGITPEFMVSRARGRFDGATVILMGCGGPGSAVMAQALLTKGAGAVVTWDQLVTAQHTDRATQRLLAHLLDEPRGVGDAIASAMSDVGPDPSFGASLQMYAN